MSSTFWENAWTAWYQKHMGVQFVSYEASGVGLSTRFLHLSLKVFLVAGSFIEMLSLLEAVSCFSFESFGDVSV